MMTVLPLATVAMVTYNSEKYIAEAIESVLCQSYENLELVICDDCSTDGTWDIVQSFKDPRIRAFRNSENLGEYPNRNRALSLAQGEYLIFIDGDDLLYPHGLEFMVRMLAAFPDSAMAMARPWSEKFVYPVQLTSRQVYLSQFLGRDVLAINFAHLLFRTSVLRTVGGVEPRYRCGDTYIQYRIALTHSCLLISDGLAWWRRNIGQASEKVLYDHINWLEALEYKNYFLTHPECPLTPVEIKQAYANIYGGFIRLIFRLALQGRTVHALRLIHAAKLPLVAWQYFLTPGRYDYLADVSAMKPLGSWRQSPFAKSSFGPKQ